MLGVKIYTSDMQTKLYDITDIKSIDINLDIFSNPDTTVIFNSSISWLKQFMGVEIYQASTSGDEVLYTGLIYNFKTNINEFGIICRDRKVLMERKITLEQKVYIGESVENVMDDLTGEWNTEFSELWTHNGWILTTIPLTIDNIDITIDSDLFTIDATDIWFTITATFEQGVSWYEILEHICNLSGFYWYLDWNQITFTQFLGEDKTSGVNYTELLYLKSDNNLTNVNNVELVTTWQINNYVIWTDWVLTTVYRTDQDSIDYFGQVLGIKEQFYWDVSQNVTKYLAKHWTIQNILQIETNPFSIDANIGDRVSIEISWVNEYLDRKGIINIITKNITFVNWTKLVRLTGADIMVNKPTADKRVKEIEKWLKYLLLKA